MTKKIFTILISLLLFAISMSSLFHENAVALPDVIDVYSPSGGQYYTGDPIGITWTYNSEGDDVKIELCLGYTPDYTINSRTNNDGYYLWSVPSSISSSSNYRIKVTNTSNPSDYDYSSYFSISSKSVTVTSPSSSNTWYGGETHSISWNSVNIGSYVKIELYDGGSYVSTIASAASTYSTYYWFVPSSLSAGSNYRIKVTSYYYSDIYDYSDYFSIGERSITVTSPESGDVWYRGSTYSITWNSGNAGDRVDIMLYTGAYSSTTIAYSRSNNGVYEWTIPGGTTLASNYRIKVQSRDYPNIYDISNYFTIDERYININSPRYGSKWYPNETYTINWNSKNAGDYVDIKLYKNNVYCATISSNTSNSGSFKWNVSDEFGPDASYKIKIRSKAYDSLYGQSNLFTIGQRIITITSPTDEEAIVKGSTYTITWDSENIGNYVDIELYHNGEYHSTIVSNYYSSESAYSSASYTWNVPSDLTSGDKYQIKISSGAYSDVEAFTEGYIVIEEGLMQKVTGPLIILLVFIILVVLTVIIFKIRRKRAMQDGGDVGETRQIYETKPQNVKTDISMDEYNNIWEKNNF